MHELEGWGDPRPSADPGHIGGIVLAATTSSRLGDGKHASPARGRYLLRTTVAMVVECCDDVAVVVGAEAAEAAGALHGMDVTTLHDPGWDEGLASSIRTGVRRAIQAGWSAALLVACDQPRLSVAHLRSLTLAHARSDGPIASFYGGKLGVPALFDRGCFPSLMALRGAATPAALLRSRTNVASIAWPDGVVAGDAVERARRFALEA